MGEEMFNSAVRQIAHNVESQDVASQVHPSGQFGSIARTARSTMYRVNEALRV